MTLDLRAALRAADESVLAEAGLKIDDFNGFELAHHSANTGRIVVVCKNGLAGESLNRTPGNLYRTVHDGLAGDGYTTHYFDPI